MLPPPELAGEEFLGLPPPFGGLPFPSGVLPEGPMGLVMQAFASDRPLTPAEYEQLKAAQQVCCRVQGYAGSLTKTWACLFIPYMLLAVHLPAAICGFIRCPFASRRAPHLGGMAAGATAAAGAGAAAALSATGNTAAAAGRQSAIAAAGAAAAAATVAARHGDITAAVAVAAQGSAAAATVTPGISGHQGRSSGAVSRQASPHRRAAPGRPCSSSGSRACPEPALG